MGKCNACSAHVLHIESLEKQLDFFRAQLQPRPLYDTPFAPTTSDPETHSSHIENLPWISEEEEELLAMKQAGLIDKDELAEALSRAGALSTDIAISNV